MGLVAWAVVAVLLTHLPLSLAWSGAVACVAVAVSQAGLPRVEGVMPAARVPFADLALRMLAGTLLTLAVTTLSASMGPAWSGVLSVFPLLGSVLAVSAQRAHGAPFVALLMRGMVIGRASFAAFFLVAASTLPTLGVLPAFACGAVVSVLVQGATKRLVEMSHKPRAPLAALD